MILRFLGFIYFGFIHELLLLILCLMIQDVWFCALLSQLILSCFQEQILCCNSCGFISYAVIISVGSV